MLHSRQFHSAGAAVTVRAAAARGGGDSAKLGRSRCAVKFKATLRGRGLPIVHRWRCAIRKIRERRRVRGGYAGTNFRCNTRHDRRCRCRRCTRVSNVATRSTLSRHHPHTSLLILSADMDWPMDMDMDMVRTLQIKLSS